MKHLLIAATLSFMAITAHAAEIGITAQETYEKVQLEGDKLLFIDVRDPVEIMFVGFTDVVHANIPFLMVDRMQWSAERGVFKLYQNPEFADMVRLELAKRGLDANAEIITLCRSGSERGEPSAAYLRENGFPNARYVINGFQGSAIKDGPQAGFRLQNGWQNSGLPWSAKMNADKIFRVDKR